jgi:uncharacterized protein YehS (DUF1456 family)
MPLTNNDTFRRLRYALDLRDSEVEEIFALSGKALERPLIIGLLKKETDPEYIECADSVLSSFLDGLIIKRRGKKDNNAPVMQVQPQPFTNNIILKKIRIALELREDDMIAVLKQAGFNISRPEMSALFRQKDHKHYKECGDQFLRNFLAGLKGYLENRKIEAKTDDPIPAK